MSKRPKYDKDFFIKFVISNAEQASQDDASIRKFFISEGLDPDEEFKKLDEKAKKIIDELVIKRKKKQGPKLR